MIKRKILGFLTENGIEGALAVAVLFYGTFIIVLGLIFYFFIYKDYIKIKMRGKFTLKNKGVESNAIFFIKILIFALSSAIIFVVLLV